MSARGTASSVEQLTARPASEGLTAHASGRWAAASAALKPRAAAARTH